MKAFVIAGGEGTRLRPYTYSTPKPMLSLGGKPILEYVILNLKKNGVKEIVITIGYLHEQIVEYFGNGNKWGVKIEFAVETEKRGTAGSIYPYLDEVVGPFIVTMGDHITNIDLGQMVKAHKKSGALATIALLKSKMQIDYGVAKVDDNGRITGFTEKPSLSHLYNTAIYVFEPEVFRYIKEKDDFAKDVIPKLIKAGKKVESYVFDDVWLDIGKVSEYERLREFFDVMRVYRDLETR